jgi:hypothetical protein
MLPLIGTIAVPTLVSLPSLTASVMAPEVTAHTGIPMGYVGVFLEFVYGTACFSSLIGVGPAARDARSASTRHPLCCALV